MCILLFSLVSIAQCGTSFSTTCRSLNKCVKSAFLAAAVFALPVELINVRAALAVDEVVVPSVVVSDQPKVVLKEYIRSTSTGIEFYDYTIGDGPAAKFGDKVSYNYKGRLAGRNIYHQSIKTDASTF